MLINKQMLLELERTGDERVHVKSLVRATSDQEFETAFTEVVTDIANEDAEVRRLAQQLSDELDGVGMVNALKVLAGCGMLINAKEAERDGIV